MSDRFLNITPANLHYRMSSTSVNLVDVRSPAEYKSLHVDGAISLPLEELDSSDLVKRIGSPGCGTEDPLYLTCYSGLRAQQAAEKLRAAGYNNLTLLNGGTEAWEKAGLPVQRHHGGISLERQLQIFIGFIILLKVVFGFTVHELFFLFLAFIGAGLITAGVTHWHGLTRVISRLPWNHRVGNGDHPSVNRTTA